MAGFSKLDDLAAKNLGVAQIHGVEREALSLVLDGGNALVAYPRSNGTRVLTELPGYASDATTVVYRPNLKAGKQPILVRESPALWHVGPAHLRDKAARGRMAAERVSLVIVEEAAAVLQSGQGEALAGWLAELDRPPVLALTSYASPRLADELHDALGIRKLTGFYLDYFRSNVMFEVIRSSSGPHKRRLALRIAQELPGQGIFYCSSVRSARELYDEFVDHAVEASMNHPQQRAPERSRAKQEFIDGHTRIYVTVGEPGDQVDDAARFAVHYDLPPSLDRYYNEAAGVGPPGKPVRCVLLFERQNYAAKLAQAEAREPTAWEALALMRAINDLHRMRGCPIGLNDAAESAAVPAKKARLLLTVLKDHGLVRETKGALFVLADEFDEKSVQAAIGGYRSVRDAERRLFLEVVNYAESGLCRLKILHRFFGLDDIERCGLCDNCRQGRESRARETARTRRARPELHHRWSRGDLVEHDAWGEGEIKQVWGDKLRIHFPGLGEKIVKADFVRPA